MTDKARQRPPSHRKPQKGKYFVFGPDIRGGGTGHGVIFENEQNLLTPPRLIVRPEEGGFPVLREKPRLRYVPKEGKMPRDLEGGLSGYWMVSERLKQIFERVDPKGFAFAACDFVLPDGSNGPQYYLCDVTRTLDALDEEASTVRIQIEPSGSKIFRALVGMTRLTFRQDIVGDAHVFVQPNLTTDPICDSALRDACKAAGLGKKDGLKGIMFDDAADL
ncbi:DUF1629 domain-containing protein [Chelativorans alearense]|uniref:DUF1629 domain-containing protein n=1 Tax=Chelativorans alearense TaxID=2681495 RepID=UPI0013D5120F|nr:DUF1629 domain-containing protein [Chelativorans alearense]